MSFSPQYEKLGMAEEIYEDNDRSETLLQDYEALRDSGSWKKTQAALPWILNSILLAMSAFLFVSAVVNSHGSGCIKRHKAFSPANEALRYLEKPTRLNGSFTFPSIYRGDPSDEIDAAWSKITDIGAMRISEADLKKLDPLFADSAVRYPEEMGGGYMGSLEVFHQLHCVNLLREFTYPDYYKTRVISWEDPTDILRTHIDHCIELLRQKVMCDIDVGAMTYNWVTVRDAPWPNFNTWHKCMDFESVLQWGLDHQVASKGRKMTQSAGVTVLPTPP